MKTPREILLRRHHSAGPKLDAVRRSALAAILDSPRRASARPFLITAWRELVLPCRRVWMGLAVVWVALLIVHLAGSESGEPATVRTEVAGSSTMRLDFQEQQRLLAEIMNSEPMPAAEPPRRSLPQPRSEIHATEVVV